jgi:hypothetical protein
VLFPAAKIIQAIFFILIFNFSILSSNSLVLSITSPAILFLKIHSSPKRPNWLPKVVASRISRHQYCQLIIKMAVRRGKGGFIYLGDRSSMIN